jgi:hypothetical protein
MRSSSCGSQTGLWFQEFQLKALGYQARVREGQLEVRQRWIWIRVRKACSIPCRQKNLSLIVYGVRSSLQSCGQAPASTVPFPTGFEI